MPAKYRYFRAESIADNPRRLKVAFSSDEKCLRVGDGSDHTEGEKYWEILDHEPGNQDLTYLLNRGAVLDEHDSHMPIGSVLSAEICADKKGRAELEMDDGGLGAERCRQMRSGMRPHVSLGYDQTKLLAQTKGEDGLPIKRFAWRGHEISSVSAPADLTVGVNRGIDFSKLTNAELQDLAKQRNITFMEESTTITPEEQQKAIDEARKLALSNDRERRKGIRELGEAYIRDYGANPKVRALIETEINTGMETEVSPAEWSANIMRTKTKDWATQNIKVIVDDDLHDDIDNYSYNRAIQSAVLSAKGNNRGTPDGLEGEVHQELYKRSSGDFQPEGFLVPYGKGKKCRGIRINADSYTAKQIRKFRAAGDLQVGVFGQGGAIVPTELYMPLIGLLRNLMVSDRLGMQTISGLEGMVTWPRHVAACTPYFVPETFLLNVSTPLLDQLAASPHRVGVTGAVSKQLLLQNAIDAQNWLRDDQLKSHAIVVDQVSLLGTGANNQPVGIANTPGIGAVNFGGAVTYLLVVNFKTQLALGNAAVADMAFVTTPLVEQKWRTTPKVGNQFPIFIWEDGSWGDETADGRVIGLRATATNQILNDRVLFGNFADAKKLFWGGLDVVVNPYSRSKEAVIEITTNSWMDVMVDHQQSFAYSVDAGDQ